MKKLAVIGSGISGTPAAFYLQDKYDVYVYEKSDRIGGHAHTLDIVEGDKTVSMDTAFVVFNEPNYPNLTKFFKDLNVKTQKHQGGFNFYNLNTNLQFNSDDFDLPRERVEEKYPASFLKMYDEATEFFAIARQDFWEGKTRIPMRDYLKNNNFSEGFKDNFIMLMGSAVWSIPADSLLDFPASTFISFFMTHDRGGLGGKSVEWETVTGGSTRYVEKVSSLLKRSIKTKQEVISVKREADKVILKTTETEEIFDKVIIAAHADQALTLLAQPTELEQEILGAFKYHHTDVTVHTDSQIMNADKSKWKSWNYGQVEKEGTIYTFVTYYANKIHSFTAEKDYFISLDTPPIELDEDRIIKVIKYKHPEFNLATLEAQKKINQLNETGPIYFSGTYFHIKNRGIDSYGFHESGISSALEIVKKLTTAE